MTSDLRPKLAFLLLLSVCAFTLPWQVLSAFIFIVMLLPFVAAPFRPFSHRAMRLFLRFVLYSIVVASAILILNGLLIRSGEPLTLVPGISLYSDGILFGAQTASRLLLLSFSVLLFFTSTPIPACIHALRQSGLSRTVVLILLLALHFLDTLPERINRIFIAQEARGAPIKAGFFSRSKAMISILSPLVLSALAESVERGVALELRGFLLEPPPSDHPSLSAPRRSISTLVLLAVSLILAVTSLARWLIN